MKKNTDKRKEAKKMTSQEFKGCRYSYGMNQNQWAEAIGISLALVKKIETGRQACSAKTAEKIWQFMGSVGATYSTTDMHGLEEHILYDIFYGHMENPNEKEASHCAAECVRHLTMAFSKASRCSSPDAKKKYFDSIEIFLSAMEIAAPEFVGMANDGKSIADIRMDILAFMDQKIKKMKQEEDMMLSGRLDGDGQYNLLSYMNEEKNEIT